MGSGKWNPILDDPLSSGDQTNKDEPRQRDSEKWRMPSGDDLKQHVRAVSAPEDLRLFPSELKLLPEEINADLDEWDTKSLTTEVLDPDG